MKKKTKLKLGIFFAMIASIVISSMISILFSMHYMSHLYRISSMNAKSIINTNRSIEFLDKRVRDNQSEHKEIKPVVL